MSYSGRMQKSHILSTFYAPGAGTGFTIWVFRLPRCISAPSTSSLA